MGSGEMKQVAVLIDRVLRSPDDAAITNAVKADVRALTASFPLYPVTQALGAT
jgi:glycine/serine hydroxymethyltransferase